MIPSPRGVTSSAFLSELDDGLDMDAVRAELRGGKVGRRAGPSAGCRELVAVTAVNSVTELEFGQLSAGTNGEGDGGECGESCTRSDLFGESRRTGVHEL